MKIPYIESPSFNSPQEGQEFDNNFITANPDCLQYVRPCSPNEIPRGLRFDGIDFDSEKKTFRLVFYLARGTWKSMPWTAWTAKSPADYCNDMASKFEETIKIFRTSYEQPGAFDPVEIVFARSETETKNGSMPSERAQTDSQKETVI